MFGINKYLIASLSLLSIIINGQDETMSPSSTEMNGGGGSDTVYSYYIDNFELDASTNFDIPYPTDVCVLTSAVDNTYVMYSCNQDGSMISKNEYGTDSDCMTATVTGTATATGKGETTKMGWTCGDDASSFLTLQFGSCGVENKDVSVVPYVCYQDSVTSTYMKFFCNDGNDDEVYENIAWGSFSSSTCQIPSSSITASAACEPFGTTGVNVTAVMDDDVCAMSPTTTTTTPTSTTTTTAASTTAATTGGEGTSQGNYINNIIMIMIGLLSLMITMIIQ
jgi:hypothetical protein